MDADTRADADAREAQRLADAIKPLLAGRDPAMQGAVLAELLSLWLAGHYPNGPQLIEFILAEHIEAVRKLLPVQIQMLKARMQ